MTKGHVCWRALLAAFPYTTPILAGFAFLGFAYGVYMNVMGGDHLAGAAPGLSAIGAAVCNALLGVRGSRGWRRTAGNCGGERCDAMTDMPLYQQAITVLLCTDATMLTRFLPFLVISARKPTPPLVRYLGNALPAAIFRSARRLLPEGCGLGASVAWHAGTHRCRCHSWAASLVAPHAGLDGGRHSPLYVARPTRVCLSMWKRPAKQAGRAKRNAQTKGPSWQWEGPLRVCRCWLCR